MNCRPFSTLVQYANRRGQAQKCGFVLQSIVAAQIEKEGANTVPLNTANKHVIRLFVDEIRRPVCTLTTKENGGALIVQNHETTF